MKTEEIRPQDLMVENRQLFAEDVTLLLQQRDSFETVNCPACDSKEYAPDFEKGGFQFNNCTACSMLFISPRPSQQQIINYYRTAKSIQHWDSKIFPSSEQARREKIFVPRAKKVVDLCRKLGVHPGTMVDVGAGYGTFCEEVQRLNYFRQVVALEPAPDLAETCRRKGLKVLESAVEDVVIDEPVNVVTNFELIEHLYRPSEFVTQCRELLVPGGLLILTTPNIQGFDLMVLRNLSDNIAGPNHLNYFHSSSLGRLLVRCGFEILESSTPGKLDCSNVRLKILSNEFDVSAQPFLKHVLIDAWDQLGEMFQQFLSDNGLSSHLWMIARKV